MDNEKLKWDIFPAKYAWRHRHSRLPLKRNRMSLSQTLDAARKTTRHFCVTSAGGHCNCSATSTVVISLNLDRILTLTNKMLSLTTVGQPDRVLHDELQRPLVHKTSKLLPRDGIRTLEPGIGRNQVWVVSVGLELFASARRGNSGEDPCAEADDVISRCPQGSILCLIITIKVLW